MDGSRALRDCADRKRYTEFLRRLRQRRTFHRANGTAAHTASDLRCEPSDLALLATGLYGAYFQERQSQTATRRLRCTGDSGVEAHEERNLAHVIEIAATGWLTFLPPSHLGRESHPPEVWTEGKPASVFCTAIEFHFNQRKRWQQLLSLWSPCAWKVAVGRQP